MSNYNKMTWYPIPEDDQEIPLGDLLVKCQYGEDKYIYVAWYQDGVWHLNNRNDTELEYEYGGMHPTHFMIVDY